MNAPEDIYADILSRLFNTTHSGQRLRVLNLIGSKGELALQVGEAEPFGLINIGDAPSLYKMCEEDTTFDYQRDDFAKSLFHTLNDKDSRLHILIGLRENLLKAGAVGASQRWDCSIWAVEKVHRSFSYLVVAYALKVAIIL